MKTQTMLRAVIAPLLLAIPGTAFTAPTIWGTDEDTGNLVKIKDYDSTPAVTDYGKLSINDRGTIRPFPDTSADADVFTNIESFTLNDRGVAFMIGNSTVTFGDGGTFTAPHLYSLRILNADGTEAVHVSDPTDPDSFNALQSVGVISGIDADDPINGIDFDPISGLLFGVTENSGRDDLLIIDPATAVATTVATSMSGTDDIEDIQFDDRGVLFLIDDDGGSSGDEDILHRAVLDRSVSVPSLDSIQVVNSTGGDHRIESLGWDFQNNVLLAFSDTSNSLLRMNTASNGFTNLADVGFNDIEGIDLVPTPTGHPVVPLPVAAWMATPLLGILGLRRMVQRQRPGM